MPLGTVLWLTSGVVVDVRRAVNNEAWRKASHDLRWHQVGYFCVVEMIPTIASSTSMKAVHDLRADLGSA
jgi:hypothetical protein